MKKKITKIENKGIDTTEMLMALDDLEKENGINKDELMKSIEQALVLAYSKNYGTEDKNVKVVMDSTDGKFHVYQEKKIVKKVEDENLEISLKDAKKINSNYEIDDLVEIEIMPKNFGRIAAQTAKGVITQKIREMSRNVLFDEFKSKEGQIVTGIIQKADPNSPIVLDLGKAEGIIRVKDQIPGESYNVNDKIKACLMSVSKGERGSLQILLSRTSTAFVKDLFDLEIPEIYEGLIEVKSISRDPGSRSKVAVYSPNPNIDPVGSCVGQKGIRIQNIINELKGEKIDVIEWNEDPAKFIAASLLPAEVLAIDTKEEEKFAEVIVGDDQLSLAIGKAGQNVVLAHKLTGWKIDIKSESQFRKIIEEAQSNAQNEDTDGVESEEPTENENIEENVDSNDEEKSGNEE